MRETSILRRWARSWSCPKSAVSTTATSGPPLRIVKFSGDALTEGVEQHRIEGTLVPIFCSAKTVADCFKYRNKIGLEVALEAVRDCWRERKCSMNDLWHYSKVCRVANVIRPYLESLT